VLGFQPEVAMLNVTAVLPVFFTYIVYVDVLPGFRVPHGMVESTVVQPLFEYTPTPTAVMLPVLVTV
jgi:hypothetical protein